MKINPKINIIPTIAEKIRFISTAGSYHKSIKF
jgi:hypothetical protein